MGKMMILSTVNWCDRDRSVLRPVGYSARVEAISSRPRERKRDNLKDQILKTKVITIKDDSFHSSLIVQRKIKLFGLPQPMNWGHCISSNLE